jgi:hypothetical protein
MLTAPTFAPAPTTASEVGVPTPQGVGIVGFQL